MTPLPPFPLAVSELPAGLAAGRLDVDPVHFGSRLGRLRRWMYAAAGDGERAVGAAVVDLGFVGTAFVWAALDGQVVTWERTRVLGRGCHVGQLPADGARFEGRDAVAIDGDGGLVIDVRPGGAPDRLQARLAAGTVTPAVLVTDTARGGWNATQKAAGYEVAGELGWADAIRPFAGGGWRDWTVGRQDRHTEWHWAAGTGHTVDGARRVGLNASTGMNAAAAGEDVVWWDGVPHALDVDTLGPEGEDPEGPWAVAGPGWRLTLEPVGVRSADEDLWLVASRYVQPVGRFVGTLPSPEGPPVEVVLSGVTEAHEARW